MWRRRQSRSQRGSAAAVRTSSTEGWLLGLLIPPHGPMVERLLGGCPGGIDGRFRAWGRWRRLRQLLWRQGRAADDPMGSTARVATGAAGIAAARHPG